MSVNPMVSKVVPRASMMAVLLVEMMENELVTRMVAGKEVPLAEKWGVIVDLSKVANLENERAEWSGCLLDQKRAVQLEDFSVGETAVKWDFEEAD